jgi:hypothetical protein
MGWIVISRRRRQIRRMTFELNEPHHKNCFVVLVTDNLNYRNQHKSAIHLELGERSLSPKLLKHSSMSSKYLL